MRCLVTGAAGFIGSHLSERLLREGFEVVGIDSFLDYYPRPVKEKNLEGLLSSPGFRFIEGELQRIDLAPLLGEVDYVFHQAAQAGVRASWGQSFQVYTENNIRATQLLLEACIGQGIQKFVFASSSSIYGDSPTLPTQEETYPCPVSPYGVTKLASEQLCYLYWKNFGVPCISLRYFTVYGPRQRPDMGLHKFIRALLAEQEIALYGDGHQARDFTYVADAVEANLLAMRSPYQGESFNIGGSHPVELWEIFRLLEAIGRKTPRIRRESVQKGDVRSTSADISKARRLLGYAPQVSLEEGLEREYQWLKEEEDRDAHR
ncbi:MAG: NAD-dependent epimerase/dehydratase family protein [Candidatus Tectomicrobia bacterium]|uniref:NAD-dependent epimerase/dehydratase family protein n=1 Tax=Tectimicrobiota bacterium TaxID=2528274 RepID=A0A932FWH3_UNCTE|nr:NAD-dependent epimerase/dehydratase family protein [Candidatus Tectomicrobia bacterium]